MGVECRGMQILHHPMPNQANPIHSPPSLTAPPLPVPYHLTLPPQSAPPCTNPPHLRHEERAMVLESQHTLPQPSHPNLPTAPTPTCAMKSESW